MQDLAQSVSYLADTALAIELFMILPYYSGVSSRDTSRNCVLQALRDRHSGSCPKNARLQVLNTLKVGVADLPLQ